MGEQPEISIEFFPPKNTVGEERLREAMVALASVHPAYASVTYGAAGSTQERTLQTVRQIQGEGGWEAVPHLTCIGSTEAGITALLHQYKDWGVGRIVALRGDLPTGMADPGFFQHAADLVAFIRDFGGFEILAAAYPEVHPQAQDAQQDLNALISKVRAGASTLVTQYCYNPDAWLSLRDSLVARGVDCPITVGVMPLGNFAQISRFSAQCGAEIPRYLRLRMEALNEDPQGQWEFGIEVVSRQCEVLLREGAPGLHFYTLNQAEATLAILQRLGLTGTGGGNRACV